MEMNKESFSLEKLATDLGVDVLDLEPLFMEYTNEMTGEIKEIQQLMSTNDYTKMQRTAHNIKGVSINLGLYEMHAAAERIDLKLKSNETTTLMEDLSHLETAFENTKKEIKNEFHKYNIEIGV